MHEQRAHFGDVRESGQCGLPANARKRRERYGGPLARHLVHDDAIDGDPDFPLRALHELDRLPHRELLGDRHRQEQRPLRIVDERLDPACVACEWARANGLGHDAGDRLLALFAGRLRNSVRLEDAVAGVGPEVADAALARMGGDEFTILLSELVSVDDAERTGRRILEAVRAPIVLDGHEVVVSASMGISLFPHDGDDANVLMANADAAMYHAKEAGGNRLSFYNKPMRSAAANRFSLEMALRRSLERDQFMLQYQPKLDLKTGQITSVEALLRWNHPELGVVSPLEFIPLAEETGLILAISDWVLRTACAQARQWRAGAHADMRVAVNLSARHFCQRDLATQISDILVASDLDPTGLEIEITESAIMGHFELAQTITRSLRELGCAVAIDDFGTGYSSLAYLKQFAVDHLKIDRSFISGLPQDADDGAIVAAVIGMAGTLGMRVVAEGVETQEQLEHLMQMGCHEAQGYLISRPVNPEQIDALVTDRGAKALIGAAFTR